MKSNRRVKFGAFLLFALALVLVACGGDDDESAPADGASDASVSAPDAAALLADATAQLQIAESFQLVIDVNGYPVTLSTGTLDLADDMALTFNYAEGAFVGPDRMQADVEIALGNLGTRVELIAIDLEHYLRGDILTGGRWLQAELIPGFSPASLVAPDTGIAAAVSTISGLEYVGEQDLDGVDTYHVRGQVAASAVNSLTFGLIRAAESQIDIDVYVLRDSHRLEQIVLHEMAPAAATGDAADAETSAETETTWIITFTDFNDDSLTIEAPTVGEAG